MIPFESLEELLTSELGFGLTTATPLQRAVCWALEGKPVPEHLWTTEVQEAFGGNRHGDSDELVLLAGVRGGKTLICAAACVWFALTADLSGVEAGLSLRAGEVPRVSLLSELTDNANESLNYIVGALTSSWVLKPFLWGEPKAGLVHLRHPTGQKVAIKVIAMTSTGISLVSRWAIAVLFDEAPRMASAEDGKVNIEEQVRAVRTRLVNGGRIMYVGSAYGDRGYVYDLYQKNWKQPNAKVLIVKAYAFWMNPVHWTEERCKKLQDTSPEDYDRDVLCNFQSARAQLFSRELVERVLRRAPRPLMIPREEGKRYVAVMDPAATTNAWTFGIAETPDNRKFNVVYLRQWLPEPGESLKPKAILKEQSELCKMYGIEVVTTDQWSSDAHRDLAYDIATEEGISFGISSLTISPANKTKMYLALLARMEQGLFEAPDVPGLINDFLNVQKRLGVGGNIKIEVIETADGRHCDYAAMLALLCGAYGDAYEVQRGKENKPRAQYAGRYSEEDMDAAEERAARADWLFDDDISPMMEEEW